MALDLSKLNFFNRLDARARVLVLLAGVAGMILLIYLATRWLGGASDTTGQSRVASAPQGLQSVPGSQLTPEYQRALQQANVQAAQQAQLSGTSAVPTLMNLGDQPSANCNIICSDQSINVKNSLDDWTRQGKISPEVASALQQLADKNVSVDEYAAELDRLVREGKLTPEQARELLEQYKKQHANALLQDSAKTMDTLIKSGQLPLDAANQLLTAQKEGASTTEYAAQLQNLVQQGKISPAVAQQLLGQYTQQRAQEAAKSHNATIQQMARSGQITADVAKAMTDLTNRGATVDEYAASLQRSVAAGKLTPAAANKLLDAYRKQKTDGEGTANEMLRKAENAAFTEISDLMREGKISPAVGAQLTEMIRKNVSLDEFRAVIADLVKQNKMTPDIAKLKMADYQEVKKWRDLTQKLGALQGNNATPAVYSDALKQAVQAGALTPEQAAQLMQEYLARAAKAATPTGVTATTEQFAKLQQRVQETAAGVTPTTLTQDFSASQEQADREAAQQREARIQALMSAMSGQAQQLVSTWTTTPVMVSKVGSSETPSGTAAPGAPGVSGAKGAGTGTPGSDITATGIPLIKAGTILFAVLDTAINSDYPDSPVMATIVDGQYKGAKLLGKITTTKGVSGQLDRVSLNFTLMNMDEWTKARTITAYAIDPDTARTVLASDVDYHYMQRFGAIMATSFLQGYATAITNEGTSTTGIFGTSTSHPELSPTQKLAVALGQMGQTLGAATQNYINTPPTVKVDSGVGLGILFMADVT